MFEILSQVQQGIPTVWSLRSVFSVVGIIYFLVLASYALAKGLKGWTISLLLTCLGVILVAAFSPSSNYGNAPANKGTAGMRLYFQDYQGNWHDKEEFIKNHSGKRVSGLYDRMEETQIYAMHLPSSANIKTGTGERVGTVNAWFFHPAALFWSPFLVSVFGVVVFFLGGAGDRS